MWFHSKGRIFLDMIVFSSPTNVQILVGRLDLCFLTHIKKYMPSIHALIFEKHVKMCVYIRQIKKPVKKKYAPVGVRGQRPRAVFSCCFEA